MIKPWKDRVEEAAHFREEDYINDVQYFMQAEIDELRQENARLRDALKQANDQAEHFEREWYLRGDVLEMATTALLEHGSPFFGRELRYADAIKAARAALGEKS